MPIKKILVRVNNSELDNSRYKCDYSHRDALVNAHRMLTTRASTSARRPRSHSEAHLQARDGRQRRPRVAVQHVVQHPGGQSRLAARLAQPPLARLHGLVEAKGDASGHMSLVRRIGCEVAVRPLAGFDHVAAGARLQIPAPSHAY